MKKINKNVMALVCTAALILGSVPTTAFAADVSSAGGTGSVPVEVTAEATTFSVTVPTGLPVNISATGEVTVNPTNSIVNNSFGPIEVKKVEVTPSNGWVLKYFGTNFTKSKVNSKEFSFQLNEENVGTDGSVAIPGFTAINGGESLNFTYDAKVAPQSEQVTQEIANVVFTLGWISEPIKPHAKGTAMSASKLKAALGHWITDNIYFSREAYNPDIHGEGTDISEAQDGSVVIVKKGYDFTVYGDGGVLAPVDCSNLFYENGASKVLDLSGLDTSHVTNMYNMFKNCKAKTLNVSGFDTSKVTNMENMFNYCYAEALDLRSFDTSQVTNMNAMFCSNLAKSIKGLNNFDTSKVTDMTLMFDAANARILDLSSFNTGNVKNMKKMFAYSKATSLDVSSFNTSNVTDMQNMFHATYATVITGLSGFDTSSVTNMEGMFWESIAPTLDLSSFDMSSVENTKWMVRDCKATKVYCRTQGDLEKIRNSQWCGASGFEVGKP